MPRAPENGEKRATVVAVTGACGGVGVSCLLILIAWVLRRWDVRVALVDADPGSGIAHHLGDGLSHGLSWADLSQEESEFRPSRLTRALPHWHDCTILTGDWRGGPGAVERVHAAVRALCAAHDVVLVDLPRGCLPDRGWHCWIVSTAQARSAGAAIALASTLSRVSLNPVSLVMRGRGEDLDPRRLERTVGAAIIGYVPEDRGLAARSMRGEDLSRGRGNARRPIRELAHYILHDLTPSHVGPAHEEEVETGASRMPERGAEARLPPPGPAIHLGERTERAR